MVSRRALGTVMTEMETQTQRWGPGSTESDRQGMTDERRGQEGQPGQPLGAHGGQVARALGPPPECTCLQVCLVFLPVSATLIRGH